MTPVTPVTPETPEIPETPDTSETPVTPDTPVTYTDIESTTQALPSQTSDVSTDQTATVKTTQPLPQTGQIDGLTTITGLVITILSGLGLPGKRKVKKD